MASGAEGVSTPVATAAVAEGAATEAGGRVGRAAEQKWQVSHKWDEGRRCHYGAVPPGP